MNRKFKAKAFYLATKRRRTCFVDARDTAGVIEYLKNTGYSEPIEIIEEIPEPATTAQLNYIKSLNITLPVSAITKEDAIALIDKETGGVLGPRPELIEYATDKGLIFSKDIRKKDLYNYIFDNLSTIDRVAFFCFSVYRWLSEDRQSNLEKHKYKEVFYQFAQQQLSNDKFLKSLDKYIGADLRFFGTLNFTDGGTAYGGSTQTTAYKACAQFLLEKFGIENAETKCIPSARERNNTRNNYFNDLTPAKSSTKQSKGLTAPTKIEEIIEMLISLLKWLFSLALIILTILGTILLVVLASSGKRKRKKWR